MRLRRLRRGAYSTSSPDAATSLLGRGWAQTRWICEKLSSTGATGKVRSGKSSCIKDRKVSLFVLAGYFFGNIPVVRDNFSLVILAIIVISVVPVVSEFLRHRRRPATD